MAAQPPYLRARSASLYFLSFLSVSLVNWLLRIRSVRTSVGPPASRGRYPVWCNFLQLWQLSLALSLLPSIRLPLSSQLGSPPLQTLQKEAATTALYQLRPLRTEHFLVDRSSLAPSSFPSRQQHLPNWLIRLG